MGPLALDDRQIPAEHGELAAAQSFGLAQREFDDGFDQLAEPARFALAGPERAIELEFQRGYPCAQVFTPRGAGFICFEPMTAPANAPRSGRGLRVLARGERFQACCSLWIGHRSASANP